MTENQKKLKELKEQIATMEKQSEEWNNPENFAKYGKVQRQLIKAQKMYEGLSKLAIEEEKLNPSKKS